MKTIVSFSELDTLRQCPHKHQLAYRERWVSPSDSPALDRGKRTHLLLEEWYLAKQRGETPSREELFIKAEIINPETGDYTDEISELVAWIFEGYIELYGDDPEWRVLAVEHDFQIPLPKPNGKPSNIRLKGKIDLLVEWRGRIWLVDHKTASRLPTDKELDLDTQFGLYAWAMKRLGHPIHGAIYNTLRTQRNKGEMALADRFSRTLIARSDEELEALARDAYQDINEALISIRKSEKTGVDRPRHFNTDTCRWRCPYTEACVIGTKGGVTTREFLAETGFVQNFTRH